MVLDRGTAKQSVGFRQSHHYPPTLLLLPEGHLSAGMGLARWIGSSCKCDGIGHNRVASAGGHIDFAQRKIFQIHSAQVVDGLLFVLAAVGAQERKVRRHVRLHVQPVLFLDRLPKETLIVLRTGGIFPVGDFGRSGSCARRLQNSSCRDKKKCGYMRTNSREMAHGEEHARDCTRKEPNSSGGNATRSSGCRRWRRDTDRSAGSLHPCRTSNNVQTPARNCSSPARPHGPTG